MIVLANYEQGETTYRHYQQQKQTQQQQPHQQQPHQQLLQYQQQRHQLHRNKRAATNIKSKLWQDGIIPFEISKAFSGKCFFIKLFGMK